MKNHSKKKPAVLPVILASGSPYRATLLQQLGLNFLAVSPDFEEEVSINACAMETALEFAKGKTKSLQGRYTNHLIIGSDQTAVIDNIILKKPGSKAKAIEQLLTCSNRTVLFYTAVVVLNTQRNHIHHACEKVSVSFRQLTRPEIERYIDKENPLDCCGSFKAEGLGISLMQCINSKDPSALIGLPLIALTDILRKEGLQIP